MVSSKSSTKRTDTDRSLLAERTKTDAELAKIGTRLEREADAVVEEARKEADVTQRAARAEADAKLQVAGASSEVVAAATAEQQLADDNLAAERKVTDEERAVERERRDRALGILLDAERHRTDETLVLERAQSDAALARILAELAESLRLRDEFLSVASHELNTPLTPILLSLRLLAKEATLTPGSPLEEAVNRYVATANRQIGKLSALIAELIDVAHRTSSAPIVSLATVDLGPIVRDVAKRYQMHAHSAGSPLIVEAPNGVIGEWDALRLDQIVANILENAIKFGAGKPVRIQLRATSELAQLSVADEGIGIATNDHARIFERFSRAVSERNYGGLGLGLYVARSNVEAMGGTIAVDAQPGRGATFTVKLPVA